MMNRALLTSLYIHSTYDTTRWSAATVAASKHVPCGAISEAFLDGVEAEVQRITAALIAGEGK